jgi:hypothetical protein
MPNAAKYSRWKERYRTDPDFRAAAIARACREQKVAYAKFPGRKKALRVLRVYGLTQDQYDILLMEQQHRCGICRSPDPVSKHWHVDHNHKKKKGDPGYVRGILCLNCNNGGGRFRDDPRLLRQAAEWFSK